MSVGRPCRQAFFSTCPSARTRVRTRSRPYTPYAHGFAIRFFFFYPPHKISVALEGGIAFIVPLSRCFLTIPTSSDVRGISGFWPVKQLPR